MATTGTAQKVATSRLQEAARRHLWLHFSRMGDYDDVHHIPIIARGEGPYVWDEHGNRYLDGLSALFCCNIGHGRAEVAEAMGDITQIQKRGITVVLIEHVMQAIMNISGRIIVLDHGRKIADGTPAEIAANKEVIEVYLGEADDA